MFRFFVIFIFIFRKTPLLFNIFLNLKSERKMSVQSAHYFLSTGAVFLPKHCADSRVNTALTKRK